MVFCSRTGSGLQLIEGWAAAGWIKSCLMSLGAIYAIVLARSNRSLGDGRCENHVSALGNTPNRTAYSIVV